MTTPDYPREIAAMQREIDSLKAELQSMGDLFIPHGTGPGAMDKMIAERDALKADAERYRWLRKGLCTEGDTSIEEAFTASGNEHEYPTEVEFDAAITAAMEKAP